MQIRSAVRAGRDRGGPPVVVDPAFGSSAIFAATETLSESTVPAGFVHPEIRQSVPCARVHHDRGGVVACSGGPAVHGADSPRPRISTGDGLAGSSVGRDDEPPGSTRRPWRGSRRRQHRGEVRRDRPPGPWQRAVSARIRRRGMRSSGSAGMVGRHRPGARATTPSSRSSRCATRRSTVGPVAGLAGWLPIRHESRQTMPAPRPVRGVRVGRAAVEVAGSRTR